MQRSRTTLSIVVLFVLAGCAADDEGELQPDVEGLPEGESRVSDDLPGAPGESSDERGVPNEDGGAVAPETPSSPPGEATCPRLRIETPSSLNVRMATSTGAAKLATLFDGEVIARQATVVGQSVNGSTSWYQVKLPAVVGYIHSSFAVCTTAPATGSSGGYYLPFKCNETRKVTQGNATSFSHKNASRYAFDFSLGVGTPMLAMAPGTVKYVYDKTKPGDYCYDGKLDRAACIDKANLVNVLHGDGTVTQFAHLSKVSVKVGDKVARGTVVGLSGSTGYSSGPHAHIVRAESCSSPFCQSVPLSFVEVGVPTTAQSVTSKNCPN